MKKNKLEVIEEYLKGGVSCRELSKKHGVHFATINKWVREVLVKKKGRVVVSGSTARSVIELQKELKLARLRNEVLEAMLDIGKEQYGIDLRKKHGTKRS